MWGKQEFFNEKFLIPVNDTNALAAKIVEILNA